MCMWGRVGKEHLIQSFIYFALYTFLYCGDLSNIIYMSLHFMAEQGQRDALCA